MEMDREGVTYTIDTIKALKSVYKDSDLYFITGSDSLLQINKWKDYEELLSICKFIAAKRPGYINAMLDRTIEDINLKYINPIYTMEAPLLDISSSQIRDRVKRDLSITYLVPRPVEVYIHNNNLYR